MDDGRMVSRGGKPIRAPKAPSSVSRLRTYRSKRDFRSTPEPSGARRPHPVGGLIYTIQKHWATHLHYDLRLEQGGVLKSWAIPKEPPKRPGEKRLAVETEDHPLDYAFFQGTIPEGEYGAGTVAVWDRGTYEALETKPDFRLVKLQGRKLRGIFALIKLRPKPGDKSKNWLFLRTKETRKQTGKEKIA
jgi:bifunctional non-homologous end joining protein LigD